MRKLLFQFVVAVAGMSLIHGNSVAIGQDAENTDAAEETASTASSDETPSEDASSNSRSAETNVDRLKVRLRPLAAEEVEVELAEWMALLKGQISTVVETELEIQALAEGADAKPLTDQLVDLRTQETAIVKRVQIVIDELTRKGGDTESAQKYLNAVSSIAGAANSTTYWAAILAEVRNWLQREDGGQLYAKKAVLALIILFVFWIISKSAGRAVARVLAKHPRASQLLENFARRTTGGVVFVVGVLMALATLGIPITPLMAALGGGSFILGFALQETLGNFASGLLIMVYRPFDLNDYVGVAGVEGTVQQMSLVSTTLLTLDNKVLVIPNTKAWGDIIMKLHGQGCSPGRSDLWNQLRRRHTKGNRYTERNHKGSPFDSG